MTNDDPMYVRHLEQALEAAELEIKGLENEARERENLLTQMQEQLNPTNMGEPASCRKQIEELQARIAMQDEALQKLARLGNGDSYGNSIGNCIAIDAISADVAAWQEKRDKEVAAKAKIAALQAAAYWFRHGADTDEMFTDRIEDELLSMAQAVADRVELKGEPK